MTQEQQLPTQEQDILMQENPEDKSALGLNVIAFLFPIVGLIIYLSNKSKYPIKAKAAGIAGLWGFASAALLQILMLLGQSSHY